MTGSGGLSSAQVQASRQQHGCNRLTACNENKLLSRFLSGFSDPIIRILLIALCINLLFMLRGAPWFETVGIAAAVFLATFISADRSRQRDLPCAAQRRPHRCHSRG